MCVSPIFLCSKNKAFGSATAPLARGVPSARVRELVSFQSQGTSVPCGRCIECLKARQNDIMVRCVNEANFKHNVWFLTLTYADANLPLSVRLERVDTATGEVFTDFKPFQLVRGKGFSSSERKKDLISKAGELIGDICKMKASRFARRLILDAPSWSDENFFSRFVVTPSINNLDVVRWQKRVRVRYERETGDKLPEYSYFICGEYGAKSARPHYHCLFFGLSWKQLGYFERDWQHRFGFTFLEKVPALNADGSSAYSIMSKYVSKYVSKGVFDCDSVLDGTAFKPRFMLSKGFGYHFSLATVSYYRCFDLFGEYDIDSLRKVDGTPLSQVELSSLFRQVRQRSRIRIDSSDCRYNLPKSYVRKIWYIKSYGKTRASSFRVLYADSLRFDYFEDYSSALQSGFTSHYSPRKVVSELLSFQDTQIANKLAFQKVKQEAYIGFLNNSKPYKFT